MHVHVRSRGHAPFWIARTVQSVSVLLLTTTPTLITRKSKKLRCVASHGDRKCTAVHELFRQCPRESSPTLRWTATTELPLGISNGSIESDAIPVRPSVDPITLEYADSSFCVLFPPNLGPLAAMPVPLPLLMLFFGLTRTGVWVAAATTAPSLKSTLFQ